MKIALHSITYAGFFYEGGPLTLDQVIDKAAECGYEGVEVMAKRPIASPFDIDTDRAKVIRDYAAVRNITLPFVAGYIDLSKPNASDREKELVFARETMRLARDLGSPYVRVYAGGEKVHEGAPIVDQWWWCVGHLKELVPVARDFGVQIALEVHTGSAQNADALLDMLDQIGSEEVKVCLDPPLLAIRGESAYEWAKRVGARIVHAHVMDFQWASPMVEYDSVPGLGVRKIERVMPCPLGEGVVEIEPFMQACKEFGYQGHFAFEVCTPFHRNHRRPTIQDVHRLVEQAAPYLRGLRDRA
ncbi:MAG: sugar phosphate isomerase/epimerase [Armatimonadetes bacterium]|nr:sugar phosphate isomerase/epimerase [Armatimonadota bacterium]